MAKSWWERLPASQRREAERSEAIARVPLEPDPTLASDVGAVDAALRADHRDEVEATAQRLVDRLCRTLEVPRVSVRVEGTRPHNRAGELHGLYESQNAHKGRITVWMRTAQRRDVVATRTFLRTLLHEVCHHLDTYLFDLPSSFHTKGFFQRESSLMRVVTRGTAHAPLRGKRGVRSTAIAADAAGRIAAPDDASGRERDPDQVDGIALLRAAAEAIRARRST